MGRCLCAAFVSIELGRISVSEKKQTKTEDRKPYVKPTLDNRGKLTEVTEGIVGGAS